MDIYPLTAKTLSDETAVLDNWPLKLQKRLLQAQTAARPLPLSDRFCVHVTVAFFTVAFFAVCFGCSRAATAETPATDTGLHFRVQRLVLDNNEGCAVADVNRDGHVDVIAGRSWYEGPEFRQHPLREMEAFGKDYLENNGDHAIDVDADGWVDVVAGSFMPQEVYWYRNPGAEGLKQNRLWDRQLLARGGTNNEITFLHDLDGDQKPEWVVDSWDTRADLMAWRFAKDQQGRPQLTPWVIGRGANGHGMGFGDLNGDGRQDILFAQGWYECPPADAASGEPWKLHRDWQWVGASCPVLVRDLNGDGRADIIRGNGHDYGIYWLEQLEPVDGKTAWREHLIDDSYSQLHALAWADLDGDGAGELITGKRVRAHSGGDPGAADPPCIYYYSWNPAEGRFERHTIEEGHVGTGLQIRVADLNSDGRPDIVTPGKSGTHVLFNEGSGN